MKSHFLRLTSLTFAATLALSNTGNTADKTRDEQVMDDRDKLIDNDTWIYNDLTKGKEVAAASGKPLMVVFRCIP
tara:strand:+ start:341 stop:565 length:225 start_codon:yes stop_codon:yes gene_type:complete